MYNARCCKADTLFPPDPDFLLGDVIRFKFLNFFLFFPPLSERPIVSRTGTVA